MSAREFRPADVAAFLDHIATETGENRYAVAAKIVRTPPGRPAIDDERAIAEALKLHADGEARSLNAALLTVAKAYGPRKKAKSTAERWRRKIRAQK